MLSRIWYIVLAVAVGVALASAFLMQSVARRQSATGIQLLTTKDANDIDILLQLDVAIRQLTVSQLQGDSKLIAAARDSSGKEGTLDGAGIIGVQARLKEINRNLEKMKSDMLALVDSDYEMIANIDPAALPNGSKLKDLPFVKEALTNKASNGVWYFNGKAYRIVGVPILEGSRVVGAALQGMRIDEDLTKLMAHRIPGASIAFTRGNEILASYSAPDGAPKSALEEMIKTRTADASALNIEHLGKNYVGVYAPVQKAVDGAPEVGYVIAREIDNAQLSVSHAPTAQDVSGLPWHMVLLLPILLGGLGLFLLRMERNQPLQKLLIASQQLAKRDIQTLPAVELRTPFRQIAQHVNDALISRAKELAERRSQTDGTAMRKNDEFTEENTTVQNIPENLLAAMSSSAGRKADPDDAHFREVFRDFVDTRRRCGETVEGLTFEKFATKLKTTRQDMISSQNAKAVKFSVYVKDGKAAPKATPET